MNLDCSASLFASDLQQVQVAHVLLVPLCTVQIMNYDTEFGKFCIHNTVIIINESNCNEHRLKDSPYIVRIKITAPSMH